MGILNQQIAIGNLEFLIEELSGRLRGQEIDAGAVLELCARKRQLGCALLLSEQDVDGFHQALLESARAYQWLLAERPREPKLDPYYLCRSKATPLLDAIAAGDLGLAREIGQLMTEPHQPQMEAEEDFHFFALFSGPLLAPAFRAASAAAELAAFEASLEGGDSRRFDVAAALLGPDEARFWPALAARTREWSAELERQRKADALDPYVRSTEAHVFVEGIALVRLAGTRGWKPPGRLRYVPEEVLSPPRVTVPDTYRP